MKTAHFPVITCRSLCFDLFILILSFVFSTLTLDLQHFTLKHCLQISELRKGSVAWNRYPEENFPIDSNCITFVVITICLNCVLNCVAYAYLCQWISFHRKYSRYYSSLSVFINTGLIFFQIIIVWAVVRWR